VFELSLFPHEFPCWIIHTEEILKKHVRRFMAPTYRILKKEKKIRVKHNAEDKIE